MKNATCKKCGGPLKKGNIKLVRPKGKKRPYRVCRVCQPIQTTFVELPPVDTSRMLKFDQGTAGNPRQARQDSTGGPWTPELVEQYEDQAFRHTRFFMTPEQAERVKTATVKHAALKMGVSFEVIPVPDYQVEADPERFGALVEVTVDWKVGE